MTDGEIAVFVHRKSVGSMNARQVSEHACFRNLAILERQMPHAIRARHGDVQNFLRRIERNTVRAWPVVDQALELAAGSEPIDAAAWIVHAGLALVSKVQVTIAREREVVAAFKAFGLAMGHDRRYLSGFR